MVQPSFEAIKVSTMNQANDNSANVFPSSSKYIGQRGVH